MQLENAGLSNINVIGKTAFYPDGLGCKSTDALGAEFTANEEVLVVNDTDAEIASIPVAGVICMPPLKPYEYTISFTKGTHFPAN